MKGQMTVPVIIGVVIVVLFALAIIPMFGSISTDTAMNQLTGQGYVVFAAGEYAVLKAVVDANSNKLVAIANSADAAVIAAQNAVTAAQNANNAAVVAAGNASVAVIAAQAANNEAVIAASAATVAATKVDLFNSAPVYLFPGDTTTTVTLLCGGIGDRLAGTWSPWTEVKDSANVTLSSKFQTFTGYISDLALFYSSAPSNIYVVELAYGGSYTTLGRIAFNSSTTNYSGTIAQIKSRRVPAGQTIYYRAMCESDDSASLRVGFRYFYD